jgi:hypothetical protein
MATERQIFFRPPEKGLKLLGSLHDDADNRAVFGDVNQRIVRIERAKVGFAAVFDELFEGNFV